MRLILGVQFNGSQVTTGPSMAKDKIEMELLAQGVLIKGRHPFGDTLIPFSNITAVTMEIENED